jgi:hypothetical protein
MFVRNEPAQVVSQYGTASEKVRFSRRAGVKRTASQTRLSSVSALPSRIMMVALAIRQRDDGLAGLLVVTVRGVFPAT